MHNPKLCEACSNYGYVPTYHPAFVAAVLADGAKRVTGDFTSGNRPARKLTWALRNANGRLNMGRPVEVPCLCERGDQFEDYVSHKGDVLWTIPRFRTHKLMVRWQHFPADTTDDQIIAHIRSEVQSFIETGGAVEWSY